MRLPSRARRRLHLENLQRKVRIRAENHYTASQHLHYKGTPLPYSRLYARGMYAQGKFFNGGCGRARCGLCDYTTPRFQQQKLLDRFERELKDYHSQQRVETA